MCPVMGQTDIPNKKITPTANSTPCAMIVSDRTVVTVRLSPALLQQGENATEKVNKYNYALPMRALYFDFQEALLGNDIILTADARRRTKPRLARLLPPPPSQSFCCNAMRGGHQVHS